MTDKTQSLRTPLYSWHTDHGGKMVDFAGFSMPIQYEAGIVREHLACRRYAGLFDVSHMGRLEFKGSQKISFLQHVLSNNVEALKPWQAQYTMLTTPTGGALDDAFLYRFDKERYILVVNASNLEKDKSWLRERLKDFPDAVMEDISQKTSLIALQGPLAKQILQDLTEDGFLPEPRRSKLGALTMAGAKVLVSRTGYTGEPNSFELFVPAQKVQDVWSAIYEMGSHLGLKPIGLGARDTLRLEASMPLYGHELGLDAEGSEIPVFALPLARVAVSLSPLKGEFVGKKALAAQFEELKGQDNGVYNPNGPLSKRIISLALLDKGIARAGDEVFLGGESIGKVTSGTSVPYWQSKGQGALFKLTGETNRRSLALAYLRADLKPGHEVRVKVRKHSLAAQVVKSHGSAEAPPYFRALPAGWSRPEINPALGRAEKKLSGLLKASLDNHKWRQTRCINLIPSEMTPSPLVRLLTITDPSGRYAEHRGLEAELLRQVFYYQGTDFISRVEEELASEMALFLGCSQVELRPVSGQMANMALFSALVKWKNRFDLKREPARLNEVWTNHIGNGGHLSAQPMGALRDYVAKNPATERFSVVNFPVKRKDPFAIDTDRLGELMEHTRPELVVLGKSMVLYPEPVAEVADLLKQTGCRAMLHYDMAHVLGLIGPYFQEPFKEGADLVTGSTHKTFFGPQRGVVAGDFEPNTPGFELWEAIENRSFPGMVSNHHLGTLVGLLAAVLEMNAFKDAYQPQVLANAKALAASLAENRVKVCGDPQKGYTQTHQVVVDVGYGRGMKTALLLEKNNIITNYQALPWDEGFTASSGLRLGVAEMTRFGMKEKDFTRLGELMARVIIKNQDVTEEAARLRRNFKELGYCFQGKEIEGFSQDLLRSF